MPSDTRQKVLIGIIIVLSIIVTAEIGLLIKLKVEHQRLSIPLLHKIGLIHNAQQNSASSTDPVTPINLSKNAVDANTDILSSAISGNNLVNVSNNAKTDTQKQVVPTAIQNNTVSTTAISDNKNTVQNNNGNTLTEADKQYIQSLVNSNLAPINDKLKQNEAAITAANNNATQALAIVNAAQTTTNKNLAKNEVAITAANNNATQALAAVNAAQINTNNRLAKDEAAIAATNENTNKTFAELSSTITTTTDRLAKDEVAITQANNNAAKLLAEMSANTKNSGSAGPINQQLVKTTSIQNAAMPVLPSKSAPENVTQQEVSSSSSQPATVSQQANPTAAQQGNAKASNSPTMAATVSSQNPNTPPITTTTQPSHKYHHISQLPGVYGRVMGADPSTYTIQLIADNGLKSLYEYMWAYCLGYSATPLHTKHLGQNWYVLVYGQFNNVYQANAALQQFPYSALRWRPFVRRMSDVQRMITDSRGEDALVGIKYNVS